MLICISDNETTVAQIIVDEVIENVHGGIALTSPPCHKKNRPAVEQKSPVCDQTIGKIVVIKSAS